MFLGINLCMYENGGVGLKKKERKKKKEEEKKKKHWSGFEEERKIKKKTREKKALKSKRQKHTLARLKCKSQLKSKPSAISAIIS